MRQTWTWGCGCESREWHEGMDHRDCPPCAERARVETLRGSPPWGEATERRIRQLRRARRR